ncbi:MAG: GGDEF domain-containing protein [Mycobacterium sp.]
MQGHNLIAVTRFMLAVLTVSMAAVPAIVTASGDGPRNPTAAVATYVCAMIGASGGLIWALGVPTRRGSIWYAITCSASIALASLCQTDPVIALTACTAFTCVAGYVAFFHTAVHMTYQFVITATVAAAAALRLSVAGHGVLALGVLWLVTVVNIAVPMGIQIVVHTLGVDLLQADRDPLTGLLNRRAFDLKILELFAAHRTENSYLVIVMIDLDRFKVLNDTHGHTAGDRALVDVAVALRATARAEAVISRAGGEEFLLADVVNVPEPVALADALREAVASGPHPTTASVGTASVPLQYLDDDNIHTAIAYLVTAADLAMYEAKRAGGNQIRCTELDTDQCRQP